MSYQREKMVKKPWWEIFDAKIENLEEISNQILDLYESSPNVDAMKSSTSIAAKLEKNGLIPSSITSTTSTTTSRSATPSPRDVPPPPPPEVTPPPPPPSDSATSSPRDIPPPPAPQETQLQDNDNKPSDNAYESEGEIKDESKPVEQQASVPQHTNSPQQKEEQVQQKQEEHQQQEQARSPHSPANHFPRSPGVDNNDTNHNQPALNSPLTTKELPNHQGSLDPEHDRSHSPPRSPGSLSPRRNDDHLRMGGRSNSGVGGKAPKGYAPVRKEDDPNRRYHPY